jgi:hypothetical protein
MLKSKPLIWIAQGLLYALFALIIGTFSSWPKYRHLEPEQALIKLSFTHHGKRVADCHQRTPEELAKLPPNMRAPMQCQRERSPVTIEVDVDGKLVYRHVAEPSGLSKDGASTVYQRLTMLSGEHRLAVRLKDSAGGSGFDFNREETVTLKPGQVMVIDFNAEKGGITLI